MSGFNTFALQQSKFQQELKCDIVKLYQTDQEINRLQQNLQEAKAKV